MSALKKLNQMNRFKTIDSFERIDLNEWIESQDRACVVAGQGWVGWRNDTRNGQPLEIKFEFDQVREFTAVHLYCNNQFLKDVQVSCSHHIIYLRLRSHSLKSFSRDYVCFV